MSANSNNTIVWFQDNVPGSPELSTTPIFFDVYNDAMSYSRWVHQQGIHHDYRVYVWNYSGGSGYWHSNTFTSIENINYP